VSARRRLPSLLALSFLTNVASAEDVTPNASPHPSGVWLATQLLPSPELTAGDGATHWGMRWQVTPLAYAWGVHSKVPPWRSFVVEPNVRYGGSIELYIAPELVFARRVEGLLRPGLRAYIPIFEHGETLSASLGASYQPVGMTDAVALEAGAYILFGTLGLQASYAPGPHTALQSIATLRVRYF
jgi:hypothetical protein